jgi:glycosyltransferase involved in cell wall biosynthesis
MKFYLLINGIVSADSASGGDQIAYFLCQFFLKKGHQLKVITSQQGKKQFVKLDNNPFVIDQGRFNNLSPLLLYLYRTFKAGLLGLKIKLKKNSVVYASSDFMVDVIPAVLIKLKNKKAKMFCGVNMIVPNPFKGYQNKGLKIPSFKLAYFCLTQQLMLFLLKHLADFVYVVNNLDKNYLLKKGFSPQKVITVYPGVKPGLLPKKRPALEYEAAWAGRLHEQKGIDDLFLSWEKVCHKLPQAKLLVIGEKKLKNYFLNQSYAENLKDNVIFAGFLTGQKYFKTLASAKLFIFPSFYESFSLVILDAMACGMPVLSYNLPVYRQIYTQGVIKIPIGNINSLSQNIYKLLKNRQKLNELSLRAKALSQKFSWEKSGQKILNQLKYVN